ncbi:MAG: 16S rRNA (adenine(1518)-N(6)/adenine(1519)-N(6))-dimethyltransferase RsmA [Trueperaceae bacterium]
MEGALHAPKTVRALLERHGLRADKTFGQNFLVDLHALMAVVNAAELTPTDTVLEVGPGLGVLTRELTERAGKVVGVELDRRMLEVLAETVGTAPNLEIRHGDAMQFDFGQLPPKSVMVANLPYNIATGLIVRALESGIFDRLVVMVQKEVAERLVATAGTDPYGAVSLIVRHFASATIKRHVPPTCFYPTPEVTSSIVRLDVRSDARPQPELFALVRDAFRHRRKTLARNLHMAGYERERVSKALEAEGLDPRIRGEALSLEAFTSLQQRLQAGA